MSKYVPQQHSLEFISFLRATGNEENASPEVHYKIADALFSEDKKDRKILLECTRGLGKSTVVEYAVIYAAALGQWPGFGKVPFVVFLGASQEGNVRQFMKNVANKIDRSPFLRTVLKVVRQTDNELELVNADGVEMAIAGRGMSTNFRGLRSKSGARPTLLIADDVLSSEMMTSEALRNTVNTNWYNSVLPALDPTRHKIIFIGTPISEDDLLAQIKNSGTFKIERYPLCTSFPCKEADFDSIWPDRFSYEYTKDMYKQYEAAGKTAAFYMEYLLEVTDLTSRLVDPEDIRWYDPDQVVKNKGNYNYYISTDFATSTKKSADFSVIAVWAVNANGDWMLVDGVCVRQTMQDNLEDLFRLVQKWKPISVGIESSGQQGGFISILEDMMFKRNVWFNLARKKGSKEPGIRPTGDKTSRFVTGVQPMFKQGKVWLPRPELVEKKNPKLYQAIQELENELSKFTLAGGVQKLAHDDCGTYETLIDTPYGSKPLGEIKDGDEVIGFGARGSVVCKVKDARMTGKKPIINVKLMDGTVLRFSEFHPILTADGTYKAASQLEVGDKLLRNLEWKQQLNMQDLNGIESQADTTSLRLEQRTERIGYTSSCMKKLTELYQMGTKSIIEIIIKIIIGLKTWSCYLQKSIEKRMRNSRGEMVRSSQNMLQRILMRCKGWPNKVKQGRIPESGNEKSYQDQMCNVNIAGLHLLRTLNLEVMLGSAVTNVMIDGMKRTQKIESVKNVEQYLHLLAEGHSTAQLPAEISTSKSLLTTVSNMYALYVERRLQELHRKLAVEKNAQELAKMNLSVSTEKISEIWLSEPEETYNFEVEWYHNYQVHNGFVVHNCIDTLNQLSEMEVWLPSEGSEEDKVDAYANDDGDIWWPEPKNNDYDGSTVF